jgi:hypothetical protein
MSGDYATDLREALSRAVEIREELIPVALDLLDPLDLIVDAAHKHLSELVWSESRSS